MDKILLIGAGGHARSCIDVLEEENQFEIAGLIYLTPDIDPDSGTSLFTLKNRNDKKYYKYIKNILRNWVKERTYEEIFFTSRNVLFTVL